jgi:hypothetical protein
MRGNLDGAIFSGAFDDEFQVGDRPNRAYFGRNVLRGLIDGIDEALARKRRVRSDGPALLASAMWIDDEELLGRLARLTSVSIVVRKAPRDHYRMPALREANEQINGLPLRTFPSFGYMAPKVDGEPQVVGPGDPMGAAVLPAIRSIGYRTTGWAPIVHAKIALLGEQWWHDEDEIGGAADIIGFRAERLWVSSANFTSGSRRNLEFGYWTDEPSLLEGAQRFLLRLIESSEAIDAEGDSLDPDLAQVKFDDMAFGEYLAEFPPDGDE